MELPQREIDLQVDVVQLAAVAGPKVVHIEFPACRSGVIHISPLCEAVALLIGAELLS